MRTRHMRTVCWLVSVLGVTHGAREEIRRQRSKVGDPGLVATMWPHRDYHSARRRPSANTRHGILEDQAALRGHTQALCRQGKRLG